MAELTFSEVDRLLKYEPETGALVWRTRSIDVFNATERRSAAHECNRWNSRYDGKEAFRYIDKKWGYKIGTIFAKNYPAHRIAWLLYYGIWPTHQIDHIDGDPANNAIGNLRDVPNAINGKNQKMHSTNTSGVNGVSWNARDKRWYARITIDGRIKHLMQSVDKEVAVAARLGAEKECGFSERHGT